MDSLTISNIDSILNGSSTERISDSKTARPLYRLVNNYQWYVVIKAGAEVPEIKEGQTYSVVFEDIYDKQYTATVTSAREDRKGYLYTLSMNEDIGELLSARRVTVSMYNQFEGMILPKAAIYQEGETSYVDVVNGGSKVKTAVKVVVTQGDQAIVEPVEEGTLAVNQQVVY